jgi:hypothetical protein
MEMPASLLVTTDASPEHPQPPPRAFAPCVYALSITESNLASLIQFLHMDNNGHRHKLQDLARARSCHPLPRGWDGGDGLQPVFFIVFASKQYSVRRRRPCELDSKTIYPLNPPFIYKPGIYGITCCTTSRHDLGCLAPRLAHMAYRLCPSHSLDVNQRLATEY